MNDRFVRDKSGDGERQQPSDLVDPKHDEREQNIELELYCDAPKNAVDLVHPIERIVLNKEHMGEDRVSIDRQVLFKRDSELLYRDRQGNINRDSQAGVVGWKNPLSATLVEPFDTVNHAVFTRKQRELKAKAG